MGSTEATGNGGAGNTGTATPARQHRPATRTRALALTRSREDKEARRRRAMSSLRSDNSQQLHYFPSQIKKSASECKKVAKSLGGFAGNAYLCRVKRKRCNIGAWHVTAVSRLTGQREVVGLRCSRECAMLLAYAANTSKRGAYTDYRAEPVQLEIDFNEVHNNK